MTADYGRPPEGFAEAPPPVRLYRRVKGDARRALCSRWGKAAAGVLFLAGCLAVFSLLAAVIAGVLGLPEKGIALEDGVLRLSPARMAVDGAVCLPGAALLPPLMTGYCAFLYRLAAGEEAALGEIFQPLQDARLWVRSVGMFFCLLLLFAASTALFLAPGAGLMALALRLPGSAGLPALYRLGLLLLGVLLLPAGAAGSACFLTRFIPAPFLLAAGEGGVFRCLSRSVRATRGYRGELFALSLSFIPPCLTLVFLAPGVFVIPYLLCSFALFSRFLSDRLARQDAGKTE